MVRKIKTALLAYGMSGKLFHAPFLSAHEGFELTAVLERNEKKAIAEYPSIKSYTDFEDLLADESIELVVVNTPNYTHFELAAKALEAKKNVLLEKPFAISSDEARILFRLADKNKMQVLPYQNRRWDSDFIAARNVIKSGALGNIVEVHLRFDRYRISIGPKKGKETNVPGSGILYDLGPHLLDQAINLFGKPSHWNLSKGKFRPGTVVDDYAHIHLVYPEGLQVFLTMSMLVADPQASFIIHGTKGSFVKNRSDVQERDLLKGLSPNSSEYGIEDPENSGKLTLINNDNKYVEKISAIKSNYSSIFDALFETVRNDAPYPVSRDEILYQLTILED